MRPPPDSTPAAAHILERLPAPPSPVRSRRHELPVDRRRDFERATRLEWVSLAYISTNVALLALVMGGSQMMWAAWIDEALSLLPPIAFLVAARFRERAPSEAFPYGCHRANSIAFLVAALALFAFGGYLVTDSTWSLLKLERPSIGTVEWNGASIWLGWLMIPVLLWTGVPAFFLGRAKLLPARRLHNKVLHADAQMMAADWKTDATSIVGIFGIVAGWWWLDASIALLIGAAIANDGIRNVCACIGDLMDRAPHDVINDVSEGLPSRLETELRKLDWVADARVRLRESGQVFFGEAFIRPVDERSLIARAEEAQSCAYRTDWRVQELVIQFVRFVEAPRPSP